MGEVFALRQNNTYMQLMAAVTVRVCRNTHDNLGTKGSLSSLAEAGNSSDRRSTMQESTGQATSIHLSQAGHDSGQSSSSSSQSGAAAGTTGAGPASQQQGRSADSCHTQQHTELQGGVVTWGDKHLKGSAGECCQACKETDKCNVWVWCANKNGCGLSPGGERHMSLEQAIDEPVLLALCG
jgi:hypothetical protein